jgi:hypothetical protein
MRTNFAEMPGKSQTSGSREQGVFERICKTENEDQGRRGGESESLKEAAIEIGNCYR